jgi:hypothetical protein
MFGLGAIVGPLVGTLTYEASPDALWIGCLLAGLASAAFALAAGRHPARLDAVPLPLDASVGPG